jgi:hypothetical protein
MGHRHVEEEHVLVWWTWVLALGKTHDLAPPHPSTPPLPQDAQNVLNPPPSLGRPGVGCKGRERWVILGCLHYYPFDSGWMWRRYVTELRDSEGKLYFYHLSNYLWGLNDGLEVLNRSNFNSCPLGQHSLWSHSDCWIDSWLYHLLAL